MPTAPTKALSGKVLVSPVCRSAYSPLGSYNREPRRGWLWEYLPDGLASLCTPHQSGGCSHWVQSPNSSDHDSTINRPRDRHNLRLEHINKSWKTYFCTNSTDHLWAVSKEHCVITSHQIVGLAFCFSWKVQKNCSWIAACVWRSLLRMPRVPEVHCLGCYYGLGPPIFALTKFYSLFNMKGGEAVLGVHWGHSPFRTAKPQ